MSKPTYEELEATMERVRAMLSNGRLTADEQRLCALAALASQPEAPVPGSVEWNDLLSTRNVLRERQPEAPKGPAAEVEPWQALFPQAQAEWDRLKRDLAAANARADAAERELKEKTASFDEAAQAWLRINAGVAHERDQLAARVKELESTAEALRNELCRDMARECTSEERQVLEAMRDADIYETADGRAAFASIYHERDVCLAELSNRAAKAKRGDK